MKQIKDMTRDELERFAEMCCSELLTTEEDDGGDWSAEWPDCGEEGATSDWWDEKEEALIDLFWKLEAKR